MKVLLVHPSALLYSEVYLRLEPLGLECVGGALNRAGHDNFLKMLFKFSKVYNVDRFYSDHDKEVKYAMRRPEEYQRSSIRRN